MGLGKQAKTLSKGQVEAVLGYLARTRWPTRNRVIFLLSAKAGLRAKEIASLTWRMVTDARGQIGQAIHLENTASKGQSGRVIPMNEELRTALDAYAQTTVLASGSFLIESERSNRMSAQAIVNLFWRWYHHIGFDGCSSHSGRRTFITNTARKISTVGGSLRDCPSSDDLRPIRHFEKEGSGSSGVRV
jgi:integrase